jgi:DNA-binding MarR family transcriptional regulator
MKKVSNIGSLVKKIYRNYSGELLILLQIRGFTDLRPSFLEVLLFICEHEGSTIKEVGNGCALKKQTMTSHLNEIERRGYIERKVNAHDKREQHIFLTEYGLKFKLNLFECINDIEKKYTDLIGDLELNRIELILKNFHSKLLIRPGLFEQISSLE